MSPAHLPDMSASTPARKPAGAVGGGQFATQPLTEAEEIELAAENAALTKVHVANEARLDAEYEAAEKTGTCLTCSVEEHEMCSMTPGCSCCEDTRSQMEQNGL